MTIINLKDQPHYIDTLAEWHHGEWAYLNPNESVEQRKVKMRSYLGNEVVPSTFIYQKANILAGSAAIVECDMDTKTELSPFYRRMGWATLSKEHYRSESVTVMEFMLKR